MRVLICGDRNWTEEVPIYLKVKQLPKDAVIIHGGCRGADTIAGKCAKTCGLKVEVYEADWEQYGKAAGPIRNSKMLHDGNPDVVWAFHRNFAESKGTKNMVEQAKKFGIPTEVIG